MGKRKLSRAGYHLLNCIVFTVCAVSFYKLGVHKAEKEIYSDAVSSSAGSETQQCSSEITTQPKTSEASEPPVEEKQEEHADLSGCTWAGIYRKLMWSGEYLKDFLEYPIYVNKEVAGTPEKDMYLIDTNVYVGASLFYFDDDDIPELALVSREKVLLYTIRDGEAYYVGSCGSDTKYLPRKLSLGSLYYRCMGGTNIAYIYDYSEAGLINGTEKYIQYEDNNDLDEYAIEFGPGYYIFSDEWKSISENVCTLNAFTPEIIQDMADKLILDDTD